MGIEQNKFGEIIPLHMCYRVSIDLNKNTIVHPFLFDVISFFSLKIVCCSMVNISLMNKGLLIILIVLL